MDERPTHVRINEEKLIEISDIFALVFKKKLYTYLKKVSLAIIRFFLKKEF